MPCGGEFGRFLLAGGINTCLTYLLYLSLLPVLSYMAAYAVSYIAGIVVSYLLNAVFVFRQSLSFAHLAHFPMVYVVPYVIGSGMLWVLVDGGGVRRELAMIVVIAVSVPLTFVLSRYVLKRCAKG